MAKRKEQEHALALRKQGMSYSHIKQQVRVSKSTLSLWLRNYPLPKERIRELRDHNEQRIESYRKTMRAKKEKRLSKVRGEVAKKLGKLSKRDLLIGGLFLYWGEGEKRKTASVGMSNTDPAVLLCFLEWLKLIGISKKKVRVYLHLYSDMNIEAEKKYWSKMLGIPVSQFYNPYIKKSSRKNIKYFNQFSHGTCNVLVGGRDLSDFTLCGFQYIREQFAGSTKA